MTGQELKEKLAQATSRREQARREGVANFLRADHAYRKLRRQLSALRLEVHVRVDGKQISLADAEDLVETFTSLGARAEVETLKTAISAAYKIEYEPF